jgi:hypothetical protein
LPNRTGGTRVMVYTQVIASVFTPSYEVSPMEVTPSPDIFAVLLFLFFVLFIALS